MSIAKPPDYHSHHRAEMLQFVPVQKTAEIIEIGCSSGFFGASLKEQFGYTVWGIEPNKDAATEAKLRLHRVFATNFEEAQLPAGKQFDGAVMNDVLEHLTDPSTLLSQLLKFLKPGAWVVASIPNVRFFPVLQQILFEKDFRYEAAGVMDDTHRRFFTRKSIKRMFEESGYVVESLVGINAPQARKFALVNYLCFNFFEDARYPQFAVVARTGTETSEYS